MLAYVFIPTNCTLLSVSIVYLHTALEYGKVLLSVPGSSDYVSVDVQCKIWACADSTQSKAKSSTSRGACKPPVSTAYSQ